ncbi:unnamed protein product, partial [Brenthis ino]
MLKSCFECISGGRLENEVYGTSINGLTQRPAWPQPRQNEKMFRLPRALNVDDKVIVKGELTENMQRLSLGLTRGTVEPDIENIAFYMNIDKETDKIYIGSKENGINTSAGDVSEPFSDIHTGSEFNVTILLRRNNQGQVVLRVGYSAYFSDKTVPINNLEDITYLIINGDVLKVNELQFLFAN